MKAVVRRGALPKRNPSSSSAHIRAELLERVGRGVGGGVEGGGRGPLGPRVVLVEVLAENAFVRDGLVGDGRRELGDL